MSTNRDAQVVVLFPSGTPVPAKRRYARLPEDTRARVLERLLVKLNAGTLTKAAYAAEALICGVSVRTLEALVHDARANAGPDGKPLAVPRATRVSKLVITSEVLECHIGVSIMNGMLRAMAKGLIPECSYSTYHHEVIKQKGRDMIHGLRRGQKFLPDQWTYLDRRDNQLMDLVTIDQFFPRMRATDRRGQEIDPSFVVVRERATGMLLAKYLYANRSEATGRALLALVGRGLRGYHHQGVFIGGIARALRCDREAVFLTDDTAASYMSLGMEIDPTNSYSSWENGAHERMHEVIRAEALQGVPASNEGPVMLNKDLEFEKSTITYEDLRDRLYRWADHYCFNRPQAALGGQTPFERWCERIEAGDVVNRADGASLAALALPEPNMARIHKYGVTLPGTGRNYAAAGLTKVGRSVAMATWPGDDETIEAFEPDGTWIGTLFHGKTMPHAVEDKIMAERGKSQRTTKALFARAHAEIAIANGPAPVAPTPATDYPAGPDGSTNGSAGEPSDDGNSADDALNVPVTADGFLDRLRVLNNPDNS